MPKMTPRFRCDVHICGAADEEVLVQAQLPRLPLVGEFVELRDEQFRKFENAANKQRYWEVVSCENGEHADASEQAVCVQQITVIRLAHPAAAPRTACQLAPL